jgi:hypothetical protein
MAQTPEGKLQAHVLKWCKKRMVGFLRLAFMPGAAVGWPDTAILLRGGRPLFIEFKRPGGKVSAKQQERIDWLRDNGYRVEVFDKYDDAIECIQRYREEDAAAAQESQDLGAACLPTKG